MAKQPIEPELVALFRPGREILVRVKPGASRNMVEMRDGCVLIRVTAAPERGRANAAVLKLLSQTLGVAKSRLCIVRGHSNPEKIIRLDEI